MNNATNGALVTFSIASYSNDNFALSNGTTCECPAGKPCGYVKAGVPTCQFSFIAVLSAKDQSVQYIASEFVPVVNKQLVAANWNRQYTFAMTAKPAVIDVFVQNFGLVIDRSTGNIIDYDTFVHVDTFVFKLDGVNSGPPIQRTVSGMAAAAGGSAQSMTIMFGYSCTGGKSGSDCDLTCNQSSIAAGVAACTGVDGIQKVCTYSGGQATGCQTCVYGFNVNQTACEQYNSVVNTKTGVSRAFRTWTIVLGVLLGVSIIFILILLGVYLWLRNREKNEEEPPPAQSRYVSNGYNAAATRPLIQKEDEWDREPMRPAAIGHVNRPPMGGETEDSFSRSNTGTAPRREAQV